MENAKTILKQKEIKEYCSAGTRTASNHRFNEMPQSHVKHPEWVGFQQQLSN